MHYETLWEFGESFQVEAATTWSGLSNLAEAEFELN